MACPLETSTNTNKNQKHKKGKNALEEIGAIDQICFISLIYFRKCNEIVEKSTETLMDKEHSIKMINATTERWTRGCGSMKGKVGNSIWV